MRFRVRSAIVAACAVITALAQSPTVVSVVRAADFGQGIVPDDFGTVYGTGLADTVYAANTSPLPTKLGNVEVFGCDQPVPLSTGIPSSGCQPFPVFFASPSQINF